MLYLETTSVIFKLLFIVKIMYLSFTLILIITSIAVQFGESRRFRGTHKAASLFSTLKMAAIYPSELSTSVQITLRYNPEDYTLRGYRCEGIQIQNIFQNVVTCPFVRSSSCTSTVSPVKQIACRSHHPILQITNHRQGLNRIQGSGRIMLVMNSKRSFGNFSKRNMSTLPFLPLC